MKKILSIIFVIAFAFSAYSCITTEEAHDVYVTVYPMQYIVESIFEGTGYTVGIVPGVTSHENSVDWSPKEIIAMTQSKYLFYVGANYDQYIDYQINSIFTNETVELIKVEDQTDYIQYIEGVYHSHDTDIPENTLGLDPHFWISPLRMRQVAALIYDKLSTKFEDPNNVMDNNYLDLVANLQTLSDAFAEVISSVGDAHVMTSTNIYGYLGTDYNLHYIPISPGYHEEAEQFTTQEKDEIVQEAVAENIKYIIYERYTSSPLSNSVFDELVDLGMDPIKLEYNILQSLTDDEVASGSNYITVMYDNLDLLKEALGYVSEG